MQTITFLMYSNRRIALKTNGIVSYTCQQVKMLLSVSATISVITQQNQSTNASDCNEAFTAVQGQQSAVYIPLYLGHSLAYFLLWHSGEL